jgi:hypothetical protein
MSFNLSINFETFEDLQTFMIEFNKFKKIQEKKINKKVDELATNSFKEITDNRGKHQQHYHNLAKLYQSEHPEYSYKQCLKIVYKNNKNDEKII